MENKPFQIYYQFWFDKKDKRDFMIKVDPITIVMAQPELENKPLWTKLEYKQCECCPMNKEEQPDCPIAINIANIIEAFKDTLSYQQCVARCITPERIYQKKTSTMEALSSVFGLVMAVSGCPIMSLFKQMARFHLPFSTIEETIVRATSFYLLREYFAYKNHKIPDLELKKLHERYEKIKILNAGLLSRIRYVNSRDSDKNAILIFHSLSELLSMEITTSLHSLESLFYAR